VKPEDVKEFMARDVEFDRFYRAYENINRPASMKAKTPAGWTFIDAIKTGLEILDGARRPEET